jgi:hypothetical protein
MLDDEEESLYQNARAYEFGDWNYPVINTHYATAEDRLHADPNMLSSSTNRAILQPSKANKQRRKSRMRDLQSQVHQHDNPGDKHSHRGSGSSSGEGSSKNVAGKARERASHLPIVGDLLRKHSSDSAKSHSSQLVDLVVEDHEAEAIERVRARKEGGPGWNSIEQKHFVKTFPDEPIQEEVRQGFNPDKPEQKSTDQTHNLTEPFALEDSETDDMDVVADQEGVDETGHEQPWEKRGGDDSGDGSGKGKGKGKERASPDIPEERNPWSD